MSLARAVRHRARQRWPALAAGVLACGVLGSAASAAEAVPPQEAGPVRIDMTVDKRDVTIGDPIVVTVRLTHPENVKVGAFDPERSLGDLALLDRRAPAPEKLPDGRIRETRVLRVARYETGPATIPSFEAVFTGPDGKEARVATPSAAITVSSVLAEGDTGPADIKKPAEMFERALWPFAVAAAALGLALGLWMWSRWRARRAQVTAPPEPAAPPRPPHEIAYGEMQRLLSSGLLEKGRIKEFYIELAEIMKRYLEARFGVDTFERTTSEILEALRLARLPVRGMTSTSEFFGACDMVKFARHTPASEETRATVERAYRLIDETKAQEQPAETPAGVAAGGAR